VSVSETPSVCDLGPLLSSVYELEGEGFGRVIGLSPCRATRSSSDLGPLLPSVSELEDASFK
jgi:hypothetical protein